MAKLSARGRTEIFRLIRHLPDDKDATNNKQFLVLMSDRNILFKRTHDWKPDSPGASSFGGSNHWSSGWTRYAKMKKGVTPEQWLAHKLEGGWTRV